MLRRSLVLAGVSALAIATSACGGGGGHAAAVPPTQNPVIVPSGPSSIGSLAYGAETLNGATFKANANLGTVHFQALIKMKNADGLALYSQAVSDPHSALYRQFITSTDIGARFGASDADYKVAADYFRSFGLKVGGWPQKLALSVTGAQPDVERAFGGATLGVFTGTEGQIIGPVTAPKLPANIPVVAVTNLVHDLSPSTQYRAMVPAAAPRGQGNNFALGYTPAQLAAAFDFTSAYAAGFTGKNIKLGIIGTGPVDPADIALYKSAFAWPQSVLGRNGAGTYKLIPTSSSAAAAASVGPGGVGSPTATPPPVTGPCSGLLPACNPEDGEAQLDTEQATLAPDAETDLYLAYVPVECGDPKVSSCPQNPTTGYGYPYIGLPLNDEEIQQAIADNTGGGNGPDILSLSFGGSERGNRPYFLNSSGVYSTSAYGVVQFAALAAEGVAVFVSSGDSGAQGCARPLNLGHQDEKCVSWPSGSNDVVSVGGVTTPLDQAGRYIGPMTGWGVQTNAGRGGSGGGVSSYIPAPSWQTGPNITPGSRNQPDVSLEGDGVTGVAVVVNSRFGFVGTGAYGGTSISAPEMAAMWALVLDACRQTSSCHGPGGTYRLGNPNPLFYGVYNNAAQYASTFYDVTFGNNAIVPCLNNPAQVGRCPTPTPTLDPGYNAGTGYDQVTGIGVPFARHLIQTIVGV